MITINQKKGTYHFSKKLERELKLKTGNFIYIVFSRKDQSFYFGKHNGLWLNDNIECVDVRFDPVLKRKFVCNTMPHPGYIFAVYGIVSQVKTLKVKPVTLENGEVIYKILRP